MINKYGTGKVNKKDYDKIRDTQIENLMTNTEQDAKAIIEMAAEIERLKERLKVMKAREEMLLCDAERDFNETERLERRKGDYECVLRLIKLSCFDYMEGAGMPEFGHYGTMFKLANKVLKGESK